jgi:hypothetical protein
MVESVYVLTEFTGGLGVGREKRRGIKTDSEFYLRSNCQDEHSDGTGGGQGPAVCLWTCGGN